MSSVRQFIRLFEDYDQYDDFGELHDLDELPTYEVAPGTDLYHGTASEERWETGEGFGMGPSWFSDSEHVADEFSGWRDRTEHSRVLQYRATQALKLVLISSGEDLQQLMEHFDCGDHYELAELIARQWDGWIIPDNYLSGADILICDPNSCMEFVQELEM